MIELINRYASLWADWQWAMLWQTAVLVGIVAVIDRVIRKWAWPQLRYALWLLVLVKLALPPGLTSPVSLTSTVPTLAQKTMAARTAGLDASAAPTNALTPTSNVAPPMATGASNGQALPPAAPQADLMPLDSAGFTTSGPSWTAYAMGVWLVGTVALAVGLAIYLRRLSAEHDAARPGDVPPWFDDVLAQAATDIGLGRLPRLVFSTKVCCPAVFGLVRPVLLIPADRLSTMTRLVARHILLHELAHIKRGDLLTHGAYMVLVTLYWFNPLLWLIRKHMQNLRELCCDATVARCLREETGAYSDTLLATGRALLARPLDPGLGLLGLFEDTGSLVVRLHWLGKKTWRYPWLRRTLVATVVALMLCCVLPMASLRAAQDDARPAECKVTLPNGATIEVVGLYNDSLKRWWRPDGTPLEEGPYEPSMKDSDVGDNIEIALRYENLPEGAGGGFGIEPGWNPRGGAIPLWYTTAEKAGQPVENVSWVNAKPAEGADATTLKVHLAMGDWQTYVEEPAYGSWISSSIGEVTFFKPYEREGKTWIPVAHMVKDCDVRVTVIDINNVEHEPDEHAGGGWVRSGDSWFGHLTADFDLPLDDVVIIRFQRRPYTWIEFKNVSLRPGQKQKIEVVTTEPEESESKKQPVDIATIRQHSPMYLKAFHSGIMRYLKENPARELPKRLWPLKFKMVNGMQVGKAQYVRSVEYFGHKGFQSLRPEHFTSETAQYTPIMYCTWLLEAEGGKGTNVLFGDGHVEWVTARELSRLKDMGMPGRVHLELGEPDRQWWLGEPCAEAVVRRNDPFDISWRPGEAFHDRVEFFAVGVLPEQAEISDHDQYTWLAVGLPSTLRKIDYGVSGGPYQPTSSSLLAPLNKPWDWKTLKPGSYRVVVLGLEGIGPDGADDWPLLLKRHVACAATARLTIGF